MTHICINKITIIGSDNGLSPGRRQAIIWINAGILLIRTWGTNFSEIISKIHAFSFKKMHFKILSAKWQQFCFGLNEFKKLLGQKCCYSSSRLFFHLCLTKVLVSEKIHYIAKIFFRWLWIDSVWPKTMREKTILGAISIYRWYLNSLVIPIINIRSYIFLWDHNTWKTVLILKWDLVILHNFL